MRKIILAFDRSSPFTTGVYLERAARSLGMEALAPNDERAAEPGLAVVKIDDSRHWGRDDERLLEHGRRVFWAIDTHTAFERVLEIARRFRIVFAAQRRGAEALRREGVPARWLALAAEPDGRHGDRLATRDIDVAFVGRVHYRRREELLRLVDAAFDSFAFDNSGDPARIGEIYGRAKVVINHAIAGDVNMRIFEAASAGAVPVTNRIAHSEWEGLDLLRVEYEGPQDALAAIDRVLADDGLRARIREHNRAVVRAKHTYVHRLRSILEALSPESEERLERKT